MAAQALGSLWRMESCRCWTAAGPAAFTTEIKQQVGSSGVFAVLCGRSCERAGGCQYIGAVFQVKYVSQSKPERVYKTSQAVSVCD